MLKSRPGSLLAHVVVVTCIIRESPQCRSRDLARDYYDIRDFLPILLQEISDAINVHNCEHIMITWMLASKLKSHLDKSITYPKEGYVLSIYWFDYINGHAKTRYLRPADRARLFSTWKIAYAFQSSWEYSHATKRYCSIERAVSWLFHRRTFLPVRLAGGSGLDQTSQQKSIAVHLANYL